MSNVVFSISMSLDGFITASNQTSEEPLGDGGQRLHEWAFDDADHRSREVLTRALSSEGAVIAGRRTYDHSVPWWGADGPNDADRTPLFVVSHDVPGNIPEGGVYTFVDGIEAALVLAKEAAGDRDVSVMGGADIGRQYIKAGLVDEIWIHLVPVLFGSGTQMFEKMASEHVPLETVEVIEGTLATHLHFRVLGRPS